MLELNNLRKEPASPSVNANIISLNMGMRFFRVKVNVHHSVDLVSDHPYSDDARGRFRSLLSIPSRFG
jgi:hypothetical protein